MTTDSSLSIGVRPTAYQWLTLATVVATLLLIAIGALVRTTGSGLGCPDWPLCHGSWHPPLQREPIIEYSHRTAAAVVSVLVLATAAVTWSRYRADRALRTLATVSVVTLFIQAWLGKVTVNRELPPSVVTVHLATALVLLAVVSWIATLASLGADRDVSRSRERSRVLRVVLVAAVVTYLVLLSGAYVVKAGATTACTTWPGCAAAPVPFVDGGRLQSIHWLHRFAVVGGAVAVGTAATAVLRAPGSDSLLRRGAWSLVALYGVQVLIGAANIWTRFSYGARVAHLATGAAIWALLVVMAVGGRYRRGVAARPMSPDTLASRRTESAHV